MAPARSQRPATDAGELRDVVAPRPALHHDLLHDGMIWDVVAEQVDLGNGGRVRREFIDHPGAVAVIAIDADDRLLLQRQYRHPVGRELWEPPAGLLDVDHEPAQAAAARELAEEADLVADRWDVLVDYFTSPGGSNEAIRMFLARDLREVPVEERFAREAEELEMEPRWVPIDDAVAAVLAGQVHNPSAVVGILATQAARAAGWSTLRPVDAPWPERHGAGDAPTSTDPLV
ncbi:ADP-ribose pyrophosphatase [mine drainage metagenome]|uniref:ADP-ribose pyrophosphatase n=1 Tax=mine drainage metagenome TaxID=410659 RepID=A0A1J5QQE6_9ZZZZ